MIANTSDPNWLLSTTVQASAALVGIVGGLLISRLVGLSAERAALDRQLRVARVDEVRTSTVLQEGQADRLRAAEDEFYEDAMSSIADSIDNLDVEEILSDHCTRGTEIEELRPFAMELVDRVRQVSVDLNSRFDPNDVPIDVDELEELGVSCPNEDAAIFQAVLRAIRKPRPRPRSYDIAGIIPAMDSSLFVRHLEVLDGLIAAERIARREHETASARVELATSSIDLKGEPTRLREALTVLIVFAVMGIAYPSIILAVGPISLTWLWRLSVVGFFLLGLSLLLGYLVRSVQSLTPDVDAQPLEFSSE